MDLSTDDRLAIHELISLHGHIMDDGEWGRLGELFTSEVVYDVSAMGGPVSSGTDAIRVAGLALGDGNPVGHHVTNIVISGFDGEVVRTRSKGIGIRADGSTGSVVYDDEVVRTPRGWRISHRVVTLRRKPLTP
jgi:hypothetical protein